MSWYANYYIGKRTKDGNIYPVGPYNADGELKIALWKSRSFASELWKRFSNIPEEFITEQLRKEFEYEDWNGEKTINATFLPVSDLPKGNYIKEGYFLLDQIAEYEETHDEEVFYDSLSTTAFLKKLESEMKFGIPKPKKDCQGNEIPVYSCADYGYYKYPAYNTEEYESYILREIASIYDDYTDEIVILCTTG